jgi:hypothetical protein
MKDVAVAFGESDAVFSTRIVEYAHVCASGARTPESDGCAAVAIGRYPERVPGE